MTFFKHVFLFITSYFKELLRKWKSLPLLFIYPILFFALISIIVITLFTPDPDEPIQVGLIDLDQSEETELVVDILDESSQLGSYIHLYKMNEDEAIEKLEQDQLSATITFPPQFTSNLYEGIEVELEMVGNPDKKVNSLLVKEFVDSIARHIRASQANILTINHYAKQMAIDQETRNELLFDQFTSFFLYVLNKDQTLQEQQITNFATANPIDYFAIGGWFIIVTVWLLSFHTLLYQEESPIMTQRLSLYGVLHMERLIARIIVILLVTAGFAIISFYSLQEFLSFNLLMEDYGRITILLLLYSCFFLVSLSILETLFTSNRIRLFTQAIFTVAVILLSGAIVPSMYLPFNVQTLLPYIFSYEVFYWVKEILLNERLYAEYIPLLLMNGVVIFIFMSCSLWKEYQSK